jgi:hypothetical protein
VVLMHVMLPSSSFWTVSEPRVLSELSGVVGEALRQGKVSLRKAAAHAHPPAVSIVAVGQSPDRRTTAGLVRNRSHVEARIVTIRDHNPIGKRNRLPAADGRLGEVPEDDWDHLIAINTASIMGLVKEWRTGAYCAAKHGVVGITKTAARSTHARTSGSTRSAPVRR